MPILFADPEARVVAAAHAGWRGAVGGVLQATVKQMCALGARPERIRAGVGPCIGPASYEVGPEFPAPFLAQNPANARFFRPAQRAGHHMFDLESYVAAELAAMKLGADRSRAPRHLRGSGDVLQLSPLRAAQGAGLWAARVGDRAGLAGITR